MTTSPTNGNSTLNISDPIRPISLWDCTCRYRLGSQERADLTISFLNSVLERREGELITLVQINDSANRPITKDKERTFVDVHCTDERGNKYIIEVQVEDERNFMPRVLEIVLTVLFRRR